MNVVRALAVRLALAGMLSASLVALVVPSAYAWLSTGNTCSSTFWICVSENDNNGVPRATTGLSDSNYGGDVYFNTTDSINDSVSSVKNASADKDVTFHHDTGNNGTAYCLDSGTQNDNLGNAGFGNDDHFSSHQAGADDGAC